MRESVCFHSGSRLNENNTVCARIKIDAVNAKQAGKRIQTAHNTFPRAQTCIFYSDVVLIYLWLQVYLANSLLLLLGQFIVCTS